MKKKMFIEGATVFVLLAVLFIYGCASGWKLSGYTDEIKAGSPNNPPVDVIGGGVKKGF
jgi:hypothetical protein